jgi:replicative DNA helicase
MAHLYNEEIEQSLLGGFILDPSNIDDADVTQEDFYKERNRVIYDAMLGLKASGNPIDLPTLYDKLEASGLITVAGGLEYISSLTDLTSGGKEYALAYADILRGLRTKRDIVKVCTSGAELAKMSTDKTPDEILNQVQSSIMGIGGTVKSSYSPMSQIVDETDKQLRYAFANAGMITGVPSGLDDVDNWTGGWQGSTLIIVAARPSIGKSAIMLNFSDNAAQRQYPVGIISMEMPKGDLIKRMACRRTGISFQRMINGMVTPDQAQQISRALGEIKKLPIFIDDRPALTDMDIARIIRKMVKHEGVKKVAIDYLQLITGSKPSQNRNQEVGTVAKNIKTVARELDIPIILLSQLNRGVEQRDDKRPMMGDLRESGEIEQHADIIALLYRDEYYNPMTEDKSIMEINFAKFRNGRTGIVKAGWNGRAQHVYNLGEAYEN